MKYEEDETRLPGEDYWAWIERIQQQYTKWLDEHGDDTCEECGKRPITESHLVGCSKVKPAT